MHVQAIKAGSLNCWPREEAHSHSCSEQLFQISENGIQQDKALGALQDMPEMGSNAY